MTKTVVILFNILVSVTILRHKENHDTEGICEHPVKALTSSHHMVPQFTFPSVMNTSPD